ncbi:hypothetical protein IAU60_006924 [Kwoniella sp. DSM 27419]
MKSFGSGAISALSEEFSINCSTVLIDASEFSVVRHFNTRAAVTLLVTPGDNTTATAISDNRKVKLITPYMALVTRRGSVVSGGVTVKVTFWYPISDPSHTLASLVTHLPNTADRKNPVYFVMQTIGMASGQVVHGNDILQMTSGQAIDLDQAMQGPWR